MPNSKSALKSRPETGRSPGAAHFRTYRLTLPPVSGVFRPRLVGLCAGLAAATFLLFCWGLRPATIRSTSPMSYGPW